MSCIQVLSVSHCLKETLTAHIVSAAAQSRMFNYNVSLIRYTLPRFLVHSLDMTPNPYGGCDPFYATRLVTQLEAETMGVSRNGVLDHNALDGRVLTLFCSE